MMTPVGRSRQTRVARRHHVAFTLVEVVVALAIVFILAAVALPQLAGYLDQKRIDDTVTQLVTVRDAISKAGGNAFYEKVGRYPGRLSELDSTLIIGNNTWVLGQDDSCGFAFAAGQRNAWNNNGPFVNFLIERGVGMITPIGMAEDSLTRNPYPPPNPPGAGTLRITFINNVVLEDALKLDETIEASNGQAVGTVQWLAPVNGRVTLYFFMPVGNAC